MMRSFAIVLAFTLTSLSALAQHAIRGTVLVEVAEGKEPLVGANVYWAETLQGTSTDSSGQFAIPHGPGLQNLVISFVGFQSDTLRIRNMKPVQVTLQPALDLDEFQVEGREDAIQLDLRSATNVQSLGQKELAKAPCCNLSESFETNPSIDASFTDAATGTRQIQMLGLSGIYTQIMQENMPSLRGSLQVLGLGFIPGPWVQSIQISKGAGSVVNGYESMTGQINYEIKKPDTNQPLYVNAYADQSSRMEANVIVNQRVSDRTSTGLLVHASGRAIRTDNNNDNFIDMPVGYHANVMNRWKFYMNNGWEGMFAAQYAKDDKTGGTLDYDPSETPIENIEAGEYGIRMNRDWIKATGKLGWVNYNKPMESLGFQASFSHLSTANRFGTRQYDNREDNAYLNFIYQGMIVSTDHSYKVGASVQVDHWVDDHVYDEIVRLESVLPYNRLYFKYTLTTPGVFAEYTLQKDRFSLIAGIRFDYPDLYETVWYSPRLHARYSVTEQTSLKLSAGKGYRVIRPFSDNFGRMASSRAIGFTYDHPAPVSSVGENLVLMDANPYEGYPDYPGDRQFLPQPRLPYGQDPEIAWNFGVNLTQTFTLDYREGNVLVDYYYTFFENRILADVERRFDQLVFYNVNNGSYAHTVQVEANYELIKRLELRLAYRWAEARSEYRLDGASNQVEIEERSDPFVPTHRGFANLAFSTRTSLKGASWVFDITGQYVGEQRLPDDRLTQEKSEIYSDAYLLANLQATRHFNRKLNVYVGCNNLFDFQQPDPIRNAANPYDSEFDASTRVWGPIFGRMVYVGLKYTLSRE